MAPSGGQAGGASAARAIASLGFVTIVAYGSWYYGFGVLLCGGDASSGGCYEAALIAPTGGLACCAPSALASSATASGTSR